MRSTSDVVAELTQAAREVHMLTEGEKLRLVVRAYVAIQEGWKMLGQPDRLKESAETMDIIRAGGVPVHLYDDEMRAILQEAVTVIREIETAMEAKNNPAPAFGKTTEQGS
ncbi:hypothetical protein PWG15_22775 (plasmid) [Ensifer adhaerens]|uniref:hypothetical protein n=1 Tax=Ensifer adhaerens TaxID=106592 RepID=UPI0023A952EF|nr:hypothetical protein [Ensifer adhaerens]WDZ80602.1 hypothetical protein PWG15_22775 [Ensifer adhaerens]